MSKYPDGTRRASTEELRICRTARIVWVELMRCIGMDATAAALMQAADIASAKPFNPAYWSEQAMEILLLTRPPVMVGNADGRGDLACLANPEVLLAAQECWPANKKIPVVVLAHQVSERTRRLIAGVGLFADCAPSLHKSMSPVAIYRLWTELLGHDLNPLASTQKMTLVKAMQCDPRKLPVADAFKS